MLFDELRTKLKANRISYTVFCKRILNCSQNTLHFLINFRGKYKKKSNILIVNEIFKWLKDKDRLNVYKESSKSDTFFNLDEKNIEKDVLKLFRK